jgi:predicted metallo-beta-lactamase superfamily hydrolase
LTQWEQNHPALSSCTFVSTPDISVLIDPGVAVMQPSFPASNLKKTLWMKKGKSAIKKTVEKQSFRKSSMNGV